ncbi:DUF1697 domain-containing protein [Streptomyces sp. NPDC047108]|uniref:DUF1697 domain-containing protein n=1 Tax=Streptomyces sp. NPDC047108 TaxID=3155025 RepID=UPI00340A8D3F
MTTYVALLRGINLGGHKKVPMADLRDLLTGLGHGDVRTLLQSGNAVFTSEERNTARLVTGLERAIAERFGFEVPCLALSADDLRAVAGRNPFPPTSVDPSRMFVTFLSGPVDPERLAHVDPHGYPPDEYRVGERELFLRCPDGMGRSKLAEVLGRTDLGLTATVRNWNTVTKLLAMTDA